MPETLILPKRYVWTIKYKDGNEVKFTGTESDAKKELTKIQDARIKPTLLRGRACNE